MKNFVLKVDLKHPLQKKFCEWVREVSKRRWYGDVDGVYYEYIDGEILVHSSTLPTNTSSPPISYEEWDQLLNKYPLPKAGDLILVNIGTLGWVKRRFLRFADKYPVVISACIKEPNEPEKEWKEYLADDWKHIPKIPGLPSLHGYTGLIENQTVKYGCLTFTFDQLKSMVNLPDGVDFFYNGKKFEKSQVVNVLKIIDEYEKSLHSNK